MVHRGPDGGGNWISPDGRVGLAHRRLSIIDLSAAASQPMQNEDGTVWITFNGEIYNHVGLRAQLVAAGHRLRTDHSDTEVLVHGFEEWGIDGLLKRIEGDYAFAIWDDATSSLFLARDRIGVKPLYFSFQDGLFLFGSEIKAIVANDVVKRDIDPSAMYHYLSFLAIPAPLTMFQGIYKLPAGHFMRVGENGRVSAVRYWDAVPGQAISASETRGLSDAAVESFYTEGIRSRLCEAVEKRMMSDVPFGVFLSGGIDSSTNVALMKRFTERPVETFTVGFKDHRRLNEIDEARAVGKTFGANHHEILIDERDMVGYLDQLIYHQDEPLADWVCIPLHFVTKLAKDSGVTVCQVGEGSDEQFAGYDEYMKSLHLYHQYWLPFRHWLPASAQRTAAALAGLAARLLPPLDAKSDILQRAASGGEHFWSGSVVFWESAKRRIVNTDAIQAPSHAPEMIASGLLPATLLECDSALVVQEMLERLDRDHPGQDALTRMTYQEFKLRLPELLLMRVDKITLSNSLEARVPFLDHKLVEFTMSIPEEWKTRDGRAKYILKKAVEGWIPDHVINRKKMGFAAPMAEWLRGEFGHQVEKTIAASRLLDRPFFKRDHVDELLREHRSGARNNAVKVWTLFNLVAWYDYWIEAA